MGLQFSVIAVAVAGLFVSTFGCTIFASVFCHLLVARDLEWLLCQMLLHITQQLARSFALAIVKSS